MKSVGITRKVDDLGRLVIPKELREIFGMPTGTPMEFFVEGETIVIRKYSMGCTECGNSTVVLYGKSKICKPCAMKLTGY